MLCAKRDISKKNPPNSKLTHCARITQELLRRGANVSLKNQLKNTALMQAVGAGPAITTSDLIEKIVRRRNLRVIKALLKVDNF